MSDKSVPSEKVTFTYKNWKGVVAVRTVIPQGIFFGKTEWHPKKQWLLKAWDCDKQDYRDFAIEDISNWKGST